jgi:hypothetical protein
VFGPRGHGKTTSVEAVLHLLQSNNGRDSGAGFIISAYFDCSCFTSSKIISLVSSVHQKLSEGLSDAYNIKSSYNEDACVEGACLSASEKTTKKIFPSLSPSGIRQHWSCSSSGVSMFLASVIDDAIEKALTQNPFNIPRPVRIILVFDEAQTLQGNLGIVQASYLVNELMKMNEVR